MLHCTQYSTVRSGTVQCSAVQYSTVLYCTVYMIVTVGCVSQERRREGVGGERRGVHVTVSVSPAAFREYVASAKVKASFKERATTKLSKNIPEEDKDEDDCQSGGDLYNMT